MAPSVSPCLLVRFLTRGGLKLRLLAAALTVLAGCGAGAVATATSATAAPSGCSFADPGSGTYAQTLCWIDMSGYDAAQATSAAGQQMTVDLLNGYTLSFTLNVSGSAVAPAALPTWSGSFLGRGGYTGVTGDPSLYQKTNGNTTATETGITLTDPGGHAVTDYSLVGADAESTDNGEYISWSSAPGTLTSLAPLGNACSGGFTGVGTTSVTCTGSAAVSGVKTGAAILASLAPTTFTQTMHGGGLQAFGFGVLVAGVEVTTNIVNGFAGDSFKVTATDATNTVVGSGNTGGGSTATTGVIGLITNSTAEKFTFAQSATSGTLANYDTAWSCTRNGASDPSLPSGAAGNSNSVTVGVGDLVSCTITNTAKPVSLSLLKKAGTPVDVNGDGLVDAGDTIAYTFAVTNTGEIEMDNVGVTDAKVGPVSCPPAANALAPGDEVTCTATYTITKADVAAGSVDNTATATGSVAGTGSTTVTSPLSSTSTPTTAPDPELTLVKSVLPTSVNAAGQGVTYSFLITNSGNVPIKAVSAHEVSFSGTGSSPVVSCPPGAAVLVPKASVLCSATYQASQGDIDAGSVTNTAVATGTDPDSNPVVSSPSTATFLTTAGPALTVVKSASSTGGSGLHAGDVITYSFVVTNTGNVTITDVAVDEGSFTGSGSLSAVTCPAGASSLAPGSQVTCTATYRVTQADVNAGNLINSATAVGTPPGGVPASVVSPPSTVDVPQQAAPALTLLKTASPTSVSKTGQKVTYTFLVTNSGNVTVNTVAIADTAFTGTGTPPVVSCPDAAISMMPGAQITCTATYRVTQADIDAGKVSNTATAAGLDPSNHLVTSPPSTALVESTAASKLGLVKTGHAVDITKDGRIDAGDRIDWTLVATNLGATTITQLSVSDPSAGKATCAKTRLAPGESTHCSVPSHSVTQSDEKAGRVVNTAVATGTVMGSASIHSPRARAVVAVDPKPAVHHPGSHLPFTGFELAPAVKTSAIAIVLGDLLLFAAVVRRRSV
jgi:uncharacterized repeat protein (TIGR01451 family)